MYNVIRGAGGKYRSGRGVLVLTTAAGRHGGSSAGVQCVIGAGRQGGSVLVGLYVPSRRALDVRRDGEVRVVPVSRGLLDGGGNGRSGSGSGWLCDGDAVEGVVDGLGLRLRVSTMPGKYSWPAWPGGTHHLEHAAGQSERRGVDSGGLHG